MKRLITIFLSSVVGMSLLAQHIPMAIYGDVYNAGILRSDGNVHIKAAPGVGRVDNHGTLRVNDTIIFYTNRDYDGLLKNTNAVDANQIAVRKNLTGNGWFMMSLPFDVNLATGVQNPLTGAALSYGGAYFVAQWYDAEERAQTGGNKPTFWKQYANNNNTLKAGVGFRVAAELPYLNPNHTGNADIQFVATASKSVRDNVFADVDKGVNLDYFATPSYFEPIEHEVYGLPGEGHWSDGWNVIGGLNSTDFVMDAKEGTTKTLGYKKTIYYFDGGATWEEFYPDGIDIGTLRPYAPIFIKINNETPKTFNSSLSRLDINNGGFAYYPEGNILEIPNSSLVFRSIQEDRYADFSLLGLKITDPSSKFNPATAYFKFKNDYSTFFKVKEDEVMLSAATKLSNRIKVWSMAPIENRDYSGSLFVNGLPYEEHYEILLGVNIPVAGEYKFSINQIYKDENKEIESVILWDKVEDIKIELLQSDYILNANNDFRTEDRFVIFFNSKDVTGLDKMPVVSEPYAYTENNILTVKNLMPGDRVQVVDLSGRPITLGVVSGNSFTAPLNQKGIYLVNIIGKKTLKVLNK